MASTYAAEEGQIEREVRIGNAVLHCTGQGTKKLFR